MPNTTRELAEKPHSRDEHPFPRGKIALNRARKRQDETHWLTGES